MSLRPHHRFSFVESPKPSSPERDRIEMLESSIKALRPSRVAYLSLHAWGDRNRGEWPDNLPEKEHVDYDLATIARWMEVFIQRFFATSQFKRSAIPNGPKVGSGGSLSPRGDWRAPSDGSAAAWLAELRGALGTVEHASPRRRKTRSRG